VDYAAYYAISFFISQRFLYRTLLSDIPSQISINSAHFNAGCTAASFDVENSMPILAVQRCLALIAQE
jgi:hypothetical protein